MGLFIDEDEALKLGQAGYEFDEHDREKSLALPAVQDRLRQSIEGA
jgi:hypothetical protein